MLLLNMVCISVQCTSWVDAAVALFYDETSTVFRIGTFVNGQNNTLSTGRNVPMHTEQPFPSKQLFF